ncbi:MAG TPA: hypothetical protein V6D47_21075 [Oscillatoriaceae cyanobacterium]
MDSQIKISLARLDQTASTDVSGTVLAPSGYVADGDASAVELQSTGDQALANVPIYITDAKGKPLSLPVTHSDAQGHYDVSYLPIGTTVVIVAKLKAPNGKPASLLALARAIGAPEHVDLSAASTLLTARLFKTTWNPLNFNPDTFAAAVALVGKNATATVDLTNGDAVVSQAQGLINQNCAISAEFQQVALGQPANPSCSQGPTLPSTSPHAGGGGSGGGGSGGGGSGGGGAAPAPTPGSVTAQIQIQDGPVMPATPSPSAT